MKRVSDMKIAILGATSHVAKGLIYNFGKYPAGKLFLFARQPDRVREYLAHIGFCSPCFVGCVNAFGDRYDAVINCVGVGKPAVLKEENGAIFSVTETFDNMVLRYLGKHKKCFYIHFSSGAVYGGDFFVPAGDGAAALIRINNVRPADYYGVAKIYAEVKHRALTQHNIVDLRLFSYFSRFMDLESGYFVSDIIKCVKAKKRLITSPVNIVRDYTHHHDLFRLIKQCLSYDSLNCAVDVRTRKPSSKFEILEYFKRSYGLKYGIHKNASVSTITGDKESYYSTSAAGASIGFSPRYSSLQNIIAESQYHLTTRRGHGKGPRKESMVSV